jgi:hypothetical protein
MSRTILSLAALFAWLLSISPAAADSVFTPARLLEGERSIEALLDVPDSLSAGLHVVMCETWITARGRAKDFDCYTEERRVELLLTEVELAGRQAAYAPAMRNEEAIAAYVLLSVRIYVTGGEPLILAVPNNGAEREKYGLLYSAPQRLTEIDWPGAPTFDSMLQHDRMLVWQVIDVDERGKVTGYSLRNASRTHGHLVDQFRAQIAAFEFIPGFFERKPRAMRYIEPLYSRVGFP